MCPRPWSRTPSSTTSSSCCGVSARTARSKRPSEGPSVHRTPSRQRSSLPGPGTLPPPLQHTHHTRLACPRPLTVRELVTKDSILLLGAVSRRPGVRPAWALAAPHPSLPPRLCGSHWSGQLPVHPSPGCPGVPRRDVRAPWAQQCPDGPASWRSHWAPRNRGLRGGRARFLQVLLTQSSDGASRCGGGPSDLPDLPAPA